jgi:hypothetical protein
LHEPSGNVDGQNRREYEREQLTDEHEPAAIEAVDQGAAKGCDDEKRQTGEKGDDSD